MRALITPITFTFHLDAGANKLWLHAISYNASKSSSPSTANGNKIETRLVINKYAWFHFGCYLLVFSTLICYGL